jgi:hypothetical protein
MLGVLYCSGRRYPLGPIRDWHGYLDTLARALDASDYVIVRTDTLATIQHRRLGYVAYRVALEPWPTEREPWPTERSWTCSS